MKRFIPFAHAKNIYEVEVNFYKNHCFTTLFLDLDNTLDSYKAKVPSNKAKKLIKKLVDSGLNIVIVSNNRKARVDNYASKLHVEFLYKSYKPLPFKINKYIKANNINKEDALIIGDQLLTDVLFGYNAKIKVLLTEKLVKEDQPTTRINRLIDIPIRKRLNKKNLLIDWRTI